MIDPEAKIQQLEAKVALYEQALRVIGRFSVFDGDSVYFGDPFGYTVRSAHASVIMAFRLAGADKQ